MKGWTSTIGRWLVKLETWKPELALFSASVKHAAAVDQHNLAGDDGNPSASLIGLPPVVEYWRSNGMLGDGPITPVLQFDFLPVP